MDKYRGITLFLIAIISSIAAVDANAAINNDLFIECTGVLAEHGATTLGEKWSKQPLPKAYSDAIKLELSGEPEVVQRWLMHRNVSGMKTIVVHTRYSDVDLPEDDNDAFYILTESEGRVTKKDLVAAHGFAFTQKSTRGVNGLRFCTGGDLGKEWLWSTTDWK